LTSSLNGNTGVRTRPLYGFQSITSPNWFPGSTRVRGFYVYTSRAFRKAPMKFSTHELIATGYAIPNWTELNLLSQFGRWTCQCAWSWSYLFHAVTMY